MREGIVYRDFRVLENGNVQLTLSLLCAKKVIAKGREIGLSLRSVRKGGIPRLIYLYRKRAGLFLGALIALFLLVLSERYVWDIRISGNETMTYEDVVAELETCGFGIGSYIPDLQSEVLENRVLLASDRISWISVYMDGTVAKIQIIEHTTPPPREDFSRPANLIARTDGQIETIQLFRGNCVVKMGQAVKKGELLVSGLYDSNTQGIRYTRAAGQVFARTERVIEVEIPLSYREKEYLEPKYMEIDLFFFGKSINFFKSTGKNTGSCDIIRGNKVFDVFGMSRIPVGLTFTMASPYREIDRERTPEEALEVAYAELDKKIAELSNGAQLIRKEIQTDLTDSSVRLVCTVTCIEDIALQAEFDVTD